MIPLPTSLMIVYQLFHALALIPHLSPLTPDLTLYLLFLTPDLILYLLLLSPDLILYLLFLSPDLILIYCLPLYIKTLRYTPVPYLDLLVFGNR